MTVDTSYLTTQVNNIVEQLHGLFDEIGVSNHERDSRESELFAALSDTLHGQLQRVDGEKNDMIDEAHRVITSIKQMQSSLDGTPRNQQRASEDPDLQITFPLNRCLSGLKEKQNAIARVHRERFEQVKKLAEALESYSSHLESSFISIELPPSNPGESIPLNFDISAVYVHALDEEFSRVYEEYNRRVSAVTSLGEDIITLWAELGTPQAQTDNLIVQHYRESPEQLGLHDSDLAALRDRREKLIEEKKARERKVKELRSAVQTLWDRLGVEECDRKGFLTSNRGCSLRAINEFEEELSRLNELKRQNLHLFVEDARCRLQELWDALYYSEEDMLDFIPAFSDVYSDALLSAHEGEIARLEALKEQRAPALELIDKHRCLVQDRDALSNSAQDSSRLMARGVKGERRDPTRLLREEKMRKRIAKELPKVEAELRSVLEQWEDEYGRPFLVQGERYLDEIAPPRAKIPPRSKTPCGPPRSNSVKTMGSVRGGNSIRGGTAPPPPAKTPTGNGTLRRNQSVHSATGNRSPTKIPGRAPLSNLPLGSNSREQQNQPAYSSKTIRGKMGPPRAPPPRMRDLASVGRPATSHGMYSERCGSVMSNRRPLSPEDYQDRFQQSYMSSTISLNKPSYNKTSVQSLHASQSQDNLPYTQHQPSFISQLQEQQRYAPPPPRPVSRQCSDSSTVPTVASGSENWETFDDVSEPEADATEVYYAKVRAAQGKRYAGDGPPGGIKKVKGIRGVGMEESITEESGIIQRVGSSDSDWTNDLSSY